MAGIVVCAYRYTLIVAEEWSLRFYSTLQGHLQAIPLAFLTLGAIGYGVGLLVSRYNMISGSGIPQVSGVIQGYFRQNWLSTLLAKFFGGALSILAGLSLGREGPSIQLGACTPGIGDRLASSKTEKKILIASGAVPVCRRPSMHRLEQYLLWKRFSNIFFLWFYYLRWPLPWRRICFQNKVRNESIFLSGWKRSVGLLRLLILWVFGWRAGAFITCLGHNTAIRIPLLNVRTRLLVPFLLAGLSVCCSSCLGGGHQIIGQLHVSTNLTFCCSFWSSSFFFHN